MFSWLINQALGHLPVWMWPAVAGGGFAIYLMAGIASHIPSIKPFAIFIKIIALVAFVFGVFMYGGAGVTAIYQAQILQMENQVKVANQASADANSKLKMAIADRSHLIKGRGYGVKIQIVHDRTEINKDCSRINDTAWTDYNRATQNKATFPADGASK